MNLTLVSIITREHEDGLAVIEDFLSKFPFKRVVIFTDRPLLFSSEALTFTVTPRPYKEWCVWRLTEFPKYVDNFDSHILNVETDSRIINPEAWDDNFLTYDYIGAKWQDGVVGNGGFTLISCEFLIELRDLYIEPTVENCFACDYYMCRKLRSYMMSKGLRYAPVEIADKFANETGRYLGAWGVHGKRMLIDLCKQKNNFTHNSDSYVIKDRYLYTAKDITPEQVFKALNLYGLVTRKLEPRLLKFGRANCYEVEYTYLPLDFKTKEE